MDDDALAAALFALGSPVRLSLYRLVVLAGQEGVGPTALADKVGMRRNLVSYHLQPLLAARLVTSRRAGKDNRYVPDTVALTRVALAIHGLALPAGMTNG